MTSECPDCGGTGEIVISPLGVNPFSGVPVHDPQLEDIVPCPRCAVARPLAPRAGRSVEQVIRAIQGTESAEERWAA